MGKILFVRGINDSVRNEIDEITKEEGILPSILIEEALESWKQKRELDRKRHHLLLYSNENDIVKFLKKLNGLTKEKYFQGFIGDDALSGPIYLKKEKWENISISKSGKNKSDNNFNSLQKISQLKNPKKNCIVGFSESRSVAESNKYEQIYNNNKLSGVTICVYHLTNLLESTFNDIIELINNHDKTFVLKNDQMLEMNLSKENISKIIF